MRKQMRWAIGLLSALVLGTLGWMGFVFYTMPLFDCYSAIRSSTRSPDGRLKAIVGEADCGATTASSGYVRVLPADQDSSADNGPESIFVVEGIRMEREPPAVQVAWQGPQRLLITYEAGGRIVHHTERFGDVAIQVRSVSQ